MNIYDFQHDGPDHGHPDACILCEKRITNFDTASMVEFTIDGEILGPDSPESNGPESIGEHLIGPSCKKRLIKAGADPKWFRPAYEIKFSFL